MSRYQKGKTDLDFTEARDSEWQWHQLGHMQVCTLLQRDNHASTPPLCFLQAGCHSCRPTNSVKALAVNGNAAELTVRRGAANDRVGSMARAVGTVRHDADVVLAERTQVADESALPLLLLPLRRHIALSTRRVSHSAIEHSVVGDGRADGVPRHDQ